MLEPFHRPLGLDETLTKLSNRPKIPGIWTEGKSVAVGQIEVHFFKNRLKGCYRSLVFPNLAFSEPLAFSHFRVKQPLFKNEQRYLRYLSKECTLFHFQCILRLEICLRIGWLRRRTSRSCIVDSRSTGGFDF